MAGEGEADALGLDDVEGLEVGAEGADGGEVVVAVALGDGGEVFVDEADDFTLVDVDEADEAFDGLGPGGVRLVGLAVGEDAHEARAFFLGVVVEAGGLGLDVDGVGVGAAARDGGAPGGVVAGEGDGVGELFEEEVGLDAGLFGPGGEGAGGEVDEGFVGGVGVAVEEDGEGLAGQGAVARRW